MALKLENKTDFKKFIGDVNNLRISCLYVNYLEIDDNEFEKIILFIVLNKHNILVTSNYHLKNLTNKSLDLMKNYVNYLKTGVFTIDKTCNNCYCFIDSENSVEDLKELIRNL